MLGEETLDRLEMRHRKQNQYQLFKKNLFSCFIFLSFFGHAMWSGGS